uniref:Fibronectin type-III domain-containing protein n=1 Tax=Myripristis murdjan TaxID=586833 RepID=A0A668AVB7_9TELE
MGKFERLQNILKCFLVSCDMLFADNAVFSSRADRPLPPRNVVVSDIKAESCYLTWDAPEDNGGSEITNYIVERRDASKKKSDFEVLTINLIDRRYGVSSLYFWKRFGILTPVGTPVTLILYLDHNSLRGSELRHAGLDASQERRRQQDCRLLRGGHEAARRHLDALQHQQPERPTGGVHSDGPGA